MYSVVINFIDYTSFKVIIKNTGYIPSAVQYILVVYFFYTKQLVTYSSTPILLLIQLVTNILFSTSVNLYCIHSLCFRFNI